MKNSKVVAAKKTVAVVAAPVAVKSTAKPAGKPGPVVCGACGRTNSHGGDCRNAAACSARRAASVKAAK